MKRIFRTPVFWIIIVSILPTLSLLHPGMPMLHDGQDHVARIANFYAALKEGIIVPRWAANLNWGYGHPILMFLYPLPEYMSSVFHVIGFSLVNSTKLVFGLSFILSTVTMYIWMNAAFGPEAAFIGALLYGFAPYRFVDLHVRGALGEHIAFIFPPLCLYFLCKLSRAKVLKEYTGAVIALGLSIGALILAHNAIALMFLPIVGLYGLYLLTSDTQKRWQFTVSAVLAVLTGFGISGFFWIPAVFEGRYTLRDIVTAGEALQRFVPWSWFIYSPWNYGGTDQLTKALGFPQWLGIIAAGILLFKIKNIKLKTVIAGTLSILVISLFIMTSASTPIWSASKLLQDFQFPWRFLSVSVFASAVLGGVAFAKINKLFILLYALFIISATVFMWFPKGYQIRDDSFYSGVYAGTTDTGESSPIWSVRFMEHTPDNPLDLLDGNATIIRGKRTTIEHDYTISVRKPSLFLENTLYFPNWMIYLNGLPTGIEWQNPTYRGLMTFRMEPGANQTVRVIFEDTKIRKVSDRLSIISGVMVIIVGIGVCIWPKK